MYVVVCSSVLIIDLKVEYLPHWVSVLSSQYHSPPNHHTEECSSPTKTEKRYLHVSVTDICGCVTVSVMLGRVMTRSASPSSASTPCVISHSLSPQGGIFYSIEKIASSTYTSTVL